MTTTETEICNRALDIIGHNEIVDINDREDPVAVRCKRAVTSQLDATLRDHWWNCAKVQGQITAAVDAPLHTWSFKFALPPNWLKFRPMNQRISWERQGRFILANELSPLDVEGIKRITNMAEIDADLADAFEYRLASRFASVFFNDTAMADKFMGQYLGRVDQARMNDGQEGRAKSWVGTGRYTSVRGY